MISLAVAAEQRDNETGAHIRRLGRFTRILAKGIGLPESEQNWIGLISMLHDVGKIGVPDRILLKQGPLTAEEIVVIQRHTITGKEILTPVQRPLHAVRRRYRALPPRAMGRHGLSERAARRRYSARGPDDGDRRRL